ncbi:MAG: hypothetical protein KGL34_00370 [Gammaproteobacteria bacterium]|nr:hypothetical protein [Gammaproteobacteria bacterium]
MRAFVYQILPDYASPSDLDPGFLVLDNRATERPDWYEYWPIRRFLRGEPLDEQAWYGFLSPRFRQKTNLDARAVHAFLAEAGASIDVALFSPSIHNTAHFWNVFEHGGHEHPGLEAVAADLLARIGRPTDLDRFVSDSRNTVNSNFFVAKPRFWRAWLEITERLYAIAEDAADPLGERLRATVPYRGRRDVQMKVFVLERMASWLLWREPGFATLARDPFAAGARVYKLPVALICDALKIAYATQGRAQYRTVFRMVAGLRRLANAGIRIGAFCGSRRVAAPLRSLAAPWHTGGEQGGGHGAADEERPA